MAICQRGLSIQPPPQRHQPLGKDVWAAFGTKAMDRKCPSYSRSHRRGMPCSGIAHVNFERTVSAKCPASPTMGIHANTLGTKGTRDGRSKRATEKGPAKTAAAPFVGLGVWLLSLFLPHRTTWDGLFNPARHGVGRHSPLPRAIRACNRRRHPGMEACGPPNARPQPASRLRAPFFSPVLSQPLLPLRPRRQPHPCTGR